MNYSIRGYLQFSIAGLPLVRASKLIGKMYGVRGFEIIKYQCFETSVKHQNKQLRMTQ